MPNIDLLNCPFCGGKAETLPLYKCDSYGNRERLWYSECGECFARSGYYNTEGEAAIAWNTRASGWISCSNRLPKDDTNVLAYHYGDGVLIASYNHHVREWMEAFECFPLTNVTHWMHLPNPPAPADNPCGGDDNAKI